MDLQPLFFTPHMNVIKASNHLCICKSCSLFKEFILKSNYQNQLQLRSDVPVPGSCELPHDTTTDESNLLTEYITPGSIVTVAADSNSIETVWFIKVIENECVSNGEDQDDYGQVIIENAMFHFGKRPGTNFPFIKQSDFKNISCHPQQLYFC